MKLTIINQFFPPELAPTGHLAASLANHRAGLGDQVTVVTSQGGYVPQQSTPPNTASERNPEVLRLWSPSLGKGSAWRRILDYVTFYVLATLRLIILPEQDMIISLTTPPFIGLSALAHKLLHPSTRIVLWSMDCYPEVVERAGLIDPGGWASRLMRWLNRRLYRGADHLVCLDAAMKDLLIANYPDELGSTAVSVIPNWEPLAEFPQITDPQPLGSYHDLALAGMFVVLYLGNAGHGHRFETVLEAAARLSSDNVLFLFIGGGAKWEELRDASIKRALENFQLVDYIPKQETAAAMATADCALITLRDRYRGVISPSKLYGNLAMGLPIIYVGPAGSNVYETIQEWNCGASLRHGDVDGFVGYVRRLKSDQTLRARLSENARRAFELEYSDQVNLARFDNLIDSALDSR